MDMVLISRQASKQSIYLKYCSRLVTWMNPAVSQTNLFNQLMLSLQICMQLRHSDIVFDNFI